MNKHNYLIEILQKLGKDQKIRINREILCPRLKDEDSAITNDEKIDKEKCIKCYLCLAFDRKTDLDKDRYPIPLEKNRSDLSIELNEQDFDQFDTTLFESEEKSLSKWVYAVLKSFGFEVYKEVGIPNDSIPSDIIKIYGVSDRKNKRADLELDFEDTTFVFENKPYSNELHKWLIGSAKKDGLNQLNFYSHSSLYKTANLVLCYNTRVKEDVITKIKEILKSGEGILIKNNIKKLIVLNTYDIYKVFIKNIEKKNKQDIIDLLKNNTVLID